LFQYVPLVVEVCIQIVEEKGLDNQGIYRVPGNSGAVNQLQEELNKVCWCSSDQCYVFGVLISTFRSQLELVSLLAGYGGIKFHDSRRLSSQIWAQAYLFW